MPVLCGLEYGSMASQPPTGQTLGHCQRFLCLKDDHHTLGGGGGGGGA